MSYSRICRLVFVVPIKGKKMSFLFCEVTDICTHVSATRDAAHHQTLETIGSFCTIKPRLTDTSLLAELRWHEGPLSGSHIPIGKPRKPMN